MMSTQGLQAAPGMTTSVRPITDPEIKAVVSTLRSMRVNAIGISVFAMIMAVLINYVNNEVAVLMPIMFGGVAVGLAFQARKSAGNLSKALANGTVMDIRAVPNRARPGRFWQFGACSTSSTSELNHMITEGVPASFTVLPETKQLLAVNGAPLRRPVTVAAPLGFQNVSSLTMPVQAQPFLQAADPYELPPPPDGWVAKACPACGQSVDGDIMFCSRCGFRLKS